MKIQYLATIATAGLAVIAAAAVYSVRSDYCPQPSAASVTALFAPCQTADALSRPDDVQTALENPDQRRVPAAAKEPPAPTPAQLVAQDFQSIAEEHATSGVAR